MIDTVITDENVYWEMVWGKSFPDKPDKEMMFEEGQALARLLAEGIIFLNNHYWENGWPEEARNKTSLNVNCNDIFAWACADAETIDYKDIKSLYDCWYANNTWGQAIWCAIRRNQKPQQPIIEAMKKDGVWTDELEALGENTLDAIVKANFIEIAINEAKKTQ